MDQSSLGAEFRTLGEEIKTRRELLDKLLRSRSESGVEAHLQDTRDSNVHILDRALTPARPYFPSLHNDLLYGLLAGLVVGVGAAMLGQILDRAIKSPEEVEREIGLPTLAVIRDVEEAGRAGGASSLHCYGYGYGNAGVEPRSAPRPRRRNGAPRAGGAPRARTGQEEAAMAAMKTPARI